MGLVRLKLQLFSASEKTGLKVQNVGSKFKISVLDFRISARFQVISLEVYEISVSGGPLEQKAEILECIIRGVKQAPIIDLGGPRGPISTTNIHVQRKEVQERLGSLVSPQFLGMAGCPSPPLFCSNCTWVSNYYWGFRLRCCCMWKYPPPPTHTHTHTHTFSTRESNDFSNLHRVTNQHLEVEPSKPTPRRRPPNPPHGE